MSGMKRVVSFFAIIGVLVILTGLLIFVNTRQDTVQYSREELEERFERYPVATLQKEFAEKNIVLSNPNSEKDFQMLIEDLPISDSKPFKYEGKNSMLYSGISKDGESFTLLENEEEQVFVVQITSTRGDHAQWEHIYHQKEGRIIESFFKSDVDTDMHIKLTFEGGKGHIEEEKL